MKNTRQQDLKIKLENHAQFLKAWDLFLNLGYSNDNKPETCPYLYAYKNGTLTYDFFDVEGAELSNPNTAFGYFTSHKNKEVTLDELFNIAKQYDQEQFQLEILVLKQERPLFEENYLKLGGRLQYLKWDECDDGTGSYQADWDAISKANISDSEFDEQIMEHAEHVTSCLHSWVECAKSKAIPEGWVLVPKEPTEHMLTKGHSTFIGAFDCKLNGAQSLHCAYNAMIQSLSESTQ